MPLLFDQGQFIENEKLLPEQIKTEKIIVSDKKSTVPELIIEKKSKNKNDLITIAQMIEVVDMMKIDKDEWDIQDECITTEDKGVNNEKSISTIINEKIININIIEPFNLTPDVIKNILINYQSAKNLYDSGDSQAIFKFMQDNIPKELFHVYDINSDYNREIYFNLFRNHINNLPSNMRIEILSQYELLKKAIIDYNDYCNEWNADIFRPYYK